MKKITTLSYLAACMALASGSALANGFKVGDTDITFGGYIKVDALVTDTSDGQIGTNIGRDFYVPSLTPVGGEGESAVFDFHARQSRFFFKTSRRIGSSKIIINV